MRGVIFDCDGVLVDSEPVANRVLSRAMTEIGLPMTPHDTMEAFMGRAWGECLRIIEERLGHPPPPDLTQRYRAERDEALKSVTPVPGIVEALDRIELPACVASSGDHGKMNVTLTATGLRERFEGRIFSAVDIGGVGKPAPDLFLHAAAQMGFTPGETTVVEDSVPGVKAAIAAGMRALAYDAYGNGAALASAGGEVFDDMARLPELLAAYPS